jgi:hypothetical protein
MTKRKRNRGNLLTVNAVSRRVLKRMRQARTKESTRWTPVEGVPVNVSVALLRRREM